MRKIGDMENFLVSANKILEGIAEKLESAKELEFSEIDKNKTVVFSIDMNNGFAKAGALYSDRVKDLIEETADFFGHCAKNGYKILAFSDKHTETSSELKNYPPHCMEGTDEPEIIGELDCIKKFVINKNCTNAFFKMPKNFEYSEYNNYIITGCCTDICIYQFAVTLAAYLNEIGLKSRVIVPISLVDTYDAPLHNADIFNFLSLESMAQNGVEIVKSIKY